MLTTMLTHHQSAFYYGTKVQRAHMCGFLDTNISTPFSYWGVGKSITQPRLVVVCHE
jgi:hypothetical protein